MCRDPKASLGGTGKPAIGTAGLMAALDEAEVSRPAAEAFRFRSSHLSANLFNQGASGNLGCSLESIKEEPNSCTVGCLGAGYSSSESTSLGVGGSAAAFFGTAPSFTPPLDLGCRHGGNGAEPDIGLMSNENNRSQLQDGLRY